MMTNYRRGLIFWSMLFFALLGSNHSNARETMIVSHSHPGIILEQVASGLGVPWGMTFLSSEQILFTERSGKLKRLDLTSMSVSKISGAPQVAAVGQGGFLDVATGPDFTRQGWIYFTYSKASSSGAVTTLARARLNQDQLVDWQDLLITDSATDTSRHFGSRIAFDQHNHVYFGVGDRGERDLAQDLSNHNGSILRLNLDGSIPRDNPFVGDSAVRDEIWSYGHRNPQGLVFDHQTSRLWSIEHGPRGGDEINLIHPGHNYGWPIISHGKEYWGPISVGEGTSKQGMEQPVKVFIPSIAPGSLLIYRGSAFPEWQGNLFSTALKLQHLNSISLSDDGQAIGELRLFEGLNERFRALTADANGWIYLSTDSGKILRVRPQP